METIRQVLIDHVLDKAAFIQNEDQLHIFIFSASSTSSPPEENADLIERAWTDRFFILEFGRGLQDLQAET